MAPPMFDDRPDSISIDTRWDRSVPVVLVIGPLDASTVADLVAELSRVCTVRGDVVLDLESVPTADAVGVAPIVAAGRSLRDRGSRLYVRHAVPPVHRLITMLDPTAAIDLSTKEP